MRLASSHMFTAAGTMVSTPSGVPSELAAVETAETPVPHIQRLLRHQELTAEAQRPRRDAKKSLFQNIHLCAPLRPLRLRHHESGESCESLIFQMASRQPRPRGFAFHQRHPRAVKLVRGDLPGCHGLEWSEWMLRCNGPLDSSGPRGAKMMECPWGEDGGKVASNGEVARWRGGLFGKVAVASRRRPLPERLSPCYSQLKEFTNFLRWGQFSRTHIFGIL
jgi:hypothetical protein